MSTHTGSLYLHPKDAWAEPPSRDAVLDALRALDIIGDPHGEYRWLAGDGLLRHITFAGCSPHLEFMPPADGGLDFCHVSLTGPFEQPRIFTGNNTLKPRCPNCKARAADWQPLADAFEQAPGRPWTCPACGAEHGIETLRWRHHAAFGRLLAQVHSVFGGEGVPSDGLLAALETSTGISWTYAWAASSD